MWNSEAKAWKWDLEEPKIFIRKSLKKGWSVKCSWLWVAACDCLQRRSPRVLSRVAPPHYCYSFQIMHLLWLELGSQMQNDRLDYKAASQGRWQEKHGREQGRLAEAWSQGHCQRAGKCPDSATRYFKYCQLPLPSQAKSWNKHMLHYVPHRLYRVSTGQWWDLSMGHSVMCGMSQV